METDGMERLIGRILRDVKVELSDEFDRNFARQAFFSERWARRKSPSSRGDRAILTDTGTLRRSITSHISGRSITFTSDLPYAAIHNEGGEIRVTAQMKRYFWARYYAARGSFGFRKDGSQRRDKRNRQLTEEAAFWRAMALMRVGSTVKMPRRQFLGTHPQLEQQVREIIEENLQAYFAQLKIDEKGIHE